MAAPEKFAAWLRDHKHDDPKFGHTYMYHPRSDAHSIALCTYIIEDLLSRSEILRGQGAQGEITYGINVAFVWPNGKRKTIDVAMGQPEASGELPSDVRGIRKAKSFSQVFISCEAKTVMTEHKKSQPRIFDELSSSHEIVHQGSQEAIAAGITVLNIANNFVSPLRQHSRRKLAVMEHRQPDVAASMVKHLRGLPIRSAVGQVGFDAYCTIVVECDNQKTARLWTDAPAPQPGDPDYYDWFVERIVRFYAERFAVIP